MHSKMNRNVFGRESNPAAAPKDVTHDERVGARIARDLSDAYGDAPSPAHDAHTRRVTAACAAMFTENPEFEALIALGESDDPDDRATYNRLTAGPLGVSLGYYEADRAAAKGGR